MAIRHFARRGDIKRLFDSDQTVTSAWTFESDITFVNDQGITFLTAAGADDGTRIYRATGNALRIEYEANTLIVNGLTGDNVAFRDGDVDKFFINHTNDRIGIQDGYTLRIHNSANTDYGDFSHDGTDFNTDFTNTTDWNITGLTNVSLSANLLMGSGTTIRGDNGTASSPTYSFVSNTDMGMYRIGSNVLGFAAGGNQMLRIATDNIFTEGSFRMRERASATTSAGSVGQIWVKNDTPCTLWFTDDAGNDHQIAFV